MNKTIIASVVLLVLVFGVYFALNRDANEKVSDSIAYSIDPLNATYNLESGYVTLVSGEATEDIVPGSASKIKTWHAASEAGDLNQDGMEDVAAILVQNGGGTGTFSYITALINTGTGAQATNSLMLGDRIGGPLKISIQDGKITVNYLDRKPDEPLVATPSVSVTKYFTVQNGVLVGQ